MIVSGIYDDAPTNKASDKENFQIDIYASK